MLNTIDVTPVEFSFVDDRLLIAQVGNEIIGKSVIHDSNPRLENVLNDLVNVVNCEGPLKQVDPAIVTITDENNNQIKNFKWSCRRLDISLNFFNKGYWIHIEVGNLKQRRPLVFELYRDRLIDPNEVFH